MAGIRGEFIDSWPPTGFEVTRLDSTPILDVNANSGSVEQVFEMDPLLDSRWDDFVLRHPRGSVFHISAWLRSLHRTYGYEPAALCTASQGQLTSGLVFCRIKSRLTGDRIVSLPFSDHCEPLVDSQSELARLLLLLQNGLADGWKYLEFRPVLQSAPMQSGLEPCHSYYLHTVDLSPSPDTLFRSFHKNCIQRKIRRAEREALQYEVGNSEELITKFYSLLVMSRRRFGLPPQPRKWFRELAKAFGSRLQVRLASHNGKPVAAMLTLQQGKTVTYKYGGSDNRYNPLGGMALLFWKTIQESKKEGMTLLDLGRADLDQAGLIRFKEHWGAQRALLTYQRFPAEIPSSRQRWLMALLRAVAPAVPDWVFILVGRVLYPHIG